MLQTLNFLRGRFPSTPWRLLAVGSVLAVLPIAACSRRSDGPPRMVDPPHSESTEAVEEARQLIAEFESDGDEARRIEIVFQLAANGSPGARSKLEDLYRNPPTPRLKLEIVNALTFVEPQNLEFALALLIDAIGAEQSPELRETALDALREIEDPRTIDVWRRIANDPDADFREAATQAIEYLTARDGLKER